MTAIKLIAGLGNPGSEYRGTRHNAGADFVEELARQCSTPLQAESKFFGLAGRVNYAGYDLRLIIPTTFMNRSGKAVAAIASFYKIAPEEILIAHDELDIPAGTARFKQGGGHGGHNGLRDIVPALGNNKNFHRLRIGIDHPGHASKVSGYVLSQPSQVDRTRIEACIDEAIAALPLLLSGDATKAMTRLHSFSAA
ncbi:MAG: aminoacyl-tRNA hydrolase [Halioglobus sp.]|uniref:Peptidyl-tRNA hydrolase n=1 Tax=Candidatus Seongchinamella marina TaxID=2518990 RepID=A0ABT3SYD6_9GAMM|nr:aminoacyl-tRNA hydrolase [Candidatus Seongchinamella marina]EEB77636.1 peptidyl-tRNA hydrolase [marine gamma proteobacterium HTCC2148]MCX2975026.1 aminoacyl-tRNA hydrolase [Candidatus Seongchinamella marina]MDG1389407.1 aminoacyl-tRNA hydrolase [Halioglobus sp.]MDG2326849.1 aminoacyl-tRNA hydrolase [Halioglobus sp.]